MEETKDMLSSVSCQMATSDARWVCRGNRDSVVGYKVIQYQRNRVNK